MQNIFLQIHTLLATQKTKLLAGLVLLSVFSMGLPSEVKASHIVGGELTYRCMGEGRFEIILTVFRDCENALPGAEFDSLAAVGVFDGRGNKINTPIPGGGNISGAIILPFMGADTLVDFIPAGCSDEEREPDVCVERAVYRKTVTLPIEREKEGYILAYQRCCRNVLISNIIEPLETGATYPLRITLEALESCNSAPELADFPPLYVCNGRPISIPQGGTDIDGDSVVYKLCKPLSGATRGQPKPQPPNPPPYDSIEWVDTIYSTEDMLGNPNDPLKIDPHTGLLTGTPAIIGQFLVGICVEEYREGRLIGTFRRDFELNVRSCDLGPIANFEAPEVVCDNPPEVTFINTSEDADTYQWFLDDGSGPVLFSNDEDPEPYIFSDTGSYVITLVVSQDTLCYDTLSKPISVQINGLNADFEVFLEECSDTIILAPIDLSTDSVGIITDWFWELDNGDTVFTFVGQNPVWGFGDPLEVDIRLTIVSSNLCVDSTAQLNVELGIVDFDFVADSIEVCPFEEANLVQNSDPNLDYTWSPTTGLNLDSPHNPTVSTDSSRWYQVTVTDGICVLEDSIYVFVKPTSEIILTDIADSCVIERIVIADGLVPGSGTWYENNDYAEVIGTGDTLLIDVPISKTVYFTGIDTISECLLRDSIDLRSYVINLDYENELVLCEGDSAVIDLENIDPIDSLSVQWEPNSIIKSSLDELSISIFSDTALTTTLYFDVINQFGCDLRDSILVIYKPSSEIILSDLADSCDLQRIVIAEGAVPGSSEWFSDPDHTNSIGTGDTLIIDVPQRQWVYYFGLDTLSECPVFDSIYLESFMVNLAYPGSLDLCENDTSTISLVNLDSLDILEIEWEPNDIIISGDLTSPTIEIFSPVPTSTVLEFHAVNQFGCEIDGTIEVEFFPDIDVFFDYDYTCGDSTVQFYNTSSGPGQVYWDFGDGNNSSENNPTHTYKEEGTYTVVLFTLGPCADTFSTEITINFFDINLQDEIIACFGEEVVLNPGGDPSLEYEWSPPELFEDPTEATQVVQVDEDTRVTVIIFDPNADTSCIRFDTIDIVVPPEFEISVDPESLLICEEGTHVIEVDVVPDGIDVDIQWFDDQGNPIADTSVIEVEAGTSQFYTVTVTDRFGCVRSAVIPVEFDLIDFDFEILFDNVICAFDTNGIVITGLDPDQEYIIEWMENPAIISGDRSDTLIIYVEGPTTFVVAVTNEDGCSKIDSITVQPNNPSLSIDAVADPPEIMRGEQSFLDVIGAPGSWTFNWTDTSAENTLSNTDIPNPIAEPLVTTTYSVKVTDEDGCMGVDTVTVRVTPNPCEFPYVFIPNAFTPNGDGSNDELFVRGLDIDEMELMIYNRYGQRVFHTTDLEDSWDGTFEGKEMPPGVYAYHLYVLCINGEDSTQSGNITLIR